jgi:hypothetical protein
VRRAALLPARSSRRVPVAAARWLPVPVPAPSVPPPRPTVPVCRRAASGLRYTAVDLAVSTARYAAVRSAAAPPPHGGSPAAFGAARRPAAAVAAACAALCPTVHQCPPLLPSPVPSPPPPSLSGSLRRRPTPRLLPWRRRAPLSACPSRPLRPPPVPSLLPLPSCLFPYLPCLFVYWFFLSSASCCPDVIPLHLRTAHAVVQMLAPTCRCWWAHFPKDRSLVPSPAPSSFPVPLAPHPRYLPGRPSPPTSHEQACGVDLGGERPVAVPVGDVAALCVLLRPSRVPDLQIAWAHRDCGRRAGELRLA